MPSLILAVDDSQDILSLYETLLGEEGYQVRTYASISTDLELIKEIKPDLAIIDLMFDNEDLGWQFIQKMRIDRGTACIPIILCTANLARVKSIEENLREKRS